jgi:hypothetical protein
LTPQEILCLPLDGPGFLTSKTVGQYLMSTFRKFILLQDEFDSKRPFGSGDWQEPLILSFAKAGLIWLRTDENDLIEDYPVNKFWGILNDLSDFLYDMDFSTSQRVLPPPPPKEWYVIYVETGNPAGGLMQDYFGEPMDEDTAIAKAEEHNKPYITNPWRAVHIPVVS